MTARPAKTLPASQLRIFLARGRFAETCAAGPGQQADAAEDQDRRQDEQAAEQHHLRRQRTVLGIGELGQKGEKEDRDLGIGDVHDDAPPV